MCAKVYLLPRWAENFTNAVLVDDTTVEWERAKEVGEQLTHLAPDLLLGRVMLIRACRHLGQFAQALEVARECRFLAENGVHAAERCLMPVLDEEEERLLSEHRHLESMVASAARHAAG